MSHPDYAQTLATLAALAPRGIQPGRERLAEVLRRLGSPELRYPAVHIAGTNGKGSTSAYAAQIAQCAASQAEALHGRPFTIGLYTSPHLHRLTERVRFSQAGELAESPKQLLADAVTAVQAASQADPATELTFFEVLTAAAFLIFARRSVDLAIVETGLGGRLDATRLCDAHATVVTSIGLDHMEWLGPTLSHIAAEKAGIFRRDVPALCVVHEPEARAVLRTCAHKVGVPLWLHPYHDEPDAQPLPLLDGQLTARLPLRGQYQRENAALAVCALSHIAGQVAEPLRSLLTVPDIVLQGLTQTRWPGRLEQLVPTTAPYLGFADREIVIDAAHNPEGAVALAGWLSTAPQKPLTVLCGVVVGKLAMEMAAPLQTAAVVVLCRPPTPRGLAAAELAALSPFSLGQPIDDWQAALHAALQQTAPGGRLLVYGSIFLIAAVRAALLDEPTDDLLVQDPGKSPASASTK